MEIVKGKRTDVLRQNKPKTNSWMKLMDALLVGDTLIIEKKEWESWGYIWGGKYANGVRRCLKNYATKKGLVIHTNVSEDLNHFYTNRAA